MSYGSASQRLRLGAHLVSRRIEERSPRIDEAPHQPRAGEAVDLRTLARHPARSARCIEVGSRFHCRMAGRDPRFEAAFENEGGIAHRVQRIGDRGCWSGRRARNRRRLRDCAAKFATIRRPDRPSPRNAPGMSRGCAANRGCVAHVEDDRRIRQSESREDRSGRQGRGHNYLAGVACSKAQTISVCSPAASVPIDTQRRFDRVIAAAVEPVEQRIERAGELRCVRVANARPDRRAGRGGQLSQRDALRDPRRCLDRNDDFEPALVVGERIDECARRFAAAASPACVSSSSLRALPSETSRRSRNGSPRTAVRRRSCRDATAR